MSTFDIQPVRHSEQVEAIRHLFRSHADSLHYYGPSFVHFDAELAVLPAPYDGTDSGLFLAVAEGQGIGCVGVQRLDDQTCQMKRLYVKPEYRGFTVGKSLIEQAIAFAKARGYQQMRLTTAAGFERAIGLYERYGFVFIEPTADEKAYGKLAMQLDLGSKTSLQA